MDDLFSVEAAEPSALVRGRVLAASRAPSAGLNGHLSSKDLGRFAPLDADSKQLVRRAAELLRISARGVVRTRRVARTIADLAGSCHVCAEHVAEALQFRMPAGLASS